jgi:hypothetical protein
MISKEFASICNELGARIALINICPHTVNVTVMIADRDGNYHVGSTRKVGAEEDCEVGALTRAAYIALTAGFPGWTALRSKECCSEKKSQNGEILETKS